MPILGKQYGSISSTGSTKVQRRTLMTGEALTAGSAAGRRGEDFNGRDSREKSAISSCGVKKGDQIGTAL